MNILHFFKKRATLGGLEKKLQELELKNAALTEQVRNVRKGRAEVDPAEHNTSKGMDAFFARIVDETPYRNFATALKQTLDRNGVNFDGRRVADIGTGPGIALKLLLEGESPASVTGYDFSRKALEYARCIMPEATFIEHDIYRSIGEKFDVVICTEVLEHLERPRLALTRIFETVSPGGILVLSVPDGRIDFSRYHINFWSPESWRFFVEETCNGQHIIFDSFRISKSSNYENNCAIVRRCT